MAYALARSQWERLERSKRTQGHKLSFHIHASRCALKVLKNTSMIVDAGSTYFSRPKPPQNPLAVGRMTRPGHRRLLAFQTI
jgi:hypothetical protein